MHSACGALGMVMSCPKNGQAADVQERKPSKKSLCLWRAKRLKSSSKR